MSNKIHQNIDPNRKILSPKNDIAFRKIFGSEINKDVLIHFINDILNLKGHKKIKSVKINNPYQLPDISIKKQSIVDVICTDDNNNQIIVEMQLGQVLGFEKRAQYYACKAYTNQAIQSHQYHNLTKVYFIAIANYSLFKDQEEYKSTHQIKNDETNKVELDGLYFVFIELPKFRKEEKELKTWEDKWIYFFKHAEEKGEGYIENIKEKELKKAYESLMRFNWTEEEYKAYEQELKIDLDNKAVLNYQLDKAERKGKAEGEEIGIKKEKFNIAKNLKKQGLTNEQIAAATGLSSEEIEKL